MNPNAKKRGRSDARARRAPNAADDAAALRARVAELEAALAACEHRKRDGARGTDAERRFRERLATMVRVNTELAAVESFDALCRRAVEFGRDELGFERLGLWFVDRSQPELALRGSFGVDEEGRIRDERSSRIRLPDASMTGRMLFASRPEPQHARGALHNEHMEPIGEGEKLAAPIWAGHDLSAVLFTDNLFSHRAFDEHDRELLMLYATAVGQLCSLRRAGDALRDSQEHLDRVLESVPTALYSAEALTNRFLVFTGAAERVLGYPAQQLKDDPDLAARIVYAPDKQAVWRAFEGGLASGKPFELEARIIHGRTGRLVWIHLYDIPVLDANGKLVRHDGVITDITEHKRAQQALRESEQRLQTLLDNTTAVVYMKDPDGRYLLVNRRFEQICGVTASEIIGKTDADIFPRAFAEAFRRNDQEVLRSRRPLKLEERAPQGDHEHSYLSVKFPVCDDDGVPYGVCGISTDITDRKRAEEALQRAHHELEQRVEERTAELVAANEALRSQMRARAEAENALRESQRALETLMSNLPGMAYRCRFDSEWTMEFVSDGCRDLLGYAPDDIIGNRTASFGSLIHPEDRELVREGVEEAVRRGAPFELTYRVRTAGGDERWVWEKGRAVLGTDGTIDALEGIIIDITERRHTEERLKLVIAAVEQSREGIAVVDLDGRLLHLNRAFADMHGYEPDDLPGKSIHELHGKEQAETIEAAYEQVRTHGHFQGEIRRRRRDGTEFPSLVYDSLLRGADGRPIGVICAVRDITDQKAAEAALRRSEETARALLNATTDSMILLDTRGTVVLINEGAAANIGKPVSQLIGTSVFDHFPPDLAAKRRARVAEVLRSARPAHYEEESRGRFYRAGMFPVFDANGNVERLAIYAEDITDRKQSELALKASEARYRTLFEDSPVALWETDFSAVRERFAAMRAAGIADLDTHLNTHPDELMALAGLVRTVDVNNAAANLFAASSRQELLDAGLERVLCPGTTDAMRGCMMAIAEGQPAFTCETVLRALDGRHIHVDARSFAVARDEAVFSKVLIVFTDITERKHAEAALRESEERFREVFENMSSGVAIYEAVNDGEDFVFKDINPSGARIGRLKREDHLGRSLLEVYPGVKELGLFAALQDVWRTGVPQRCPTSAYEDERISLWVENYVCKLPTGEVVAVYDDITDRKRAEEALREREEFAKGLIESMSDGLTVLDATGVHIDVNRAFCVMTGFSREELIGVGPPHPYWPEEEYENMHDAFERTLQGAFSEFEVRFKRKSGQRFPVLVFPSAVRDADGRVTCFLASVKDITERKRAEEALRANERQMRQIIDLVPHMIFAKDRNGRFILGNREVATAHGTTPEELRGKSYPQLRGAENEYAEFLKADREVIDTGRARFIPEEQFTDASGKVRILQTTKIPFTVPETHEPAVLGVAVDITDRRRAENALRNSEARLRTILDYMQEAVVFADEHDRVRHINEFACELLGTRRDDAIDRDLLSLHSEYLRPRVARIIEMFRKDPARSAVEARRARGQRELIFRFSPVRKPDGSYGGVIANIIDITEQVRMQHQLSEARRMEAVGTLAGGVAHDFNNLMATVLGLASHMGSRPGRPSSDYAKLKQIEESAETAGALAHQLLTFAKGGKILPRVVALAEVLDHAARVFDAAKPDNVQLEVHLADDLWPVECDPTQIEQVVLNLMRNAVEAMPAGGTIGITVENTVVPARIEETHPALAAGQYVRVTAADTGRGMAPEIAARVFDPFFTTKFTGSGLGLAAAYGILRAHNGAIAVESTPSQGATFRFWLPRAHDPTVPLHLRPAQADDFEPTEPP